MPYSPQEWNNGDPETPLSASRLTHMETGIKGAHDVADANAVARHSHSNKATLDSITAAYTTAKDTKLTGIAAGATANASDAQLRDRSTHTGTQPSTTISDLTEAVQDIIGQALAGGTGATVTYNDAANTITISATGTTDTEAIRDAIGVALVGVGNISVAVDDAGNTITISTTATANATDAALRDRATHTGAQAISTVTGLQTALDGKASSSHSHAAAQVTDFDTEVSNNTDVAANTAARHGHSNKATLDATTAAFTTSKDTKLSGIATGATANATDAALRDRGTHTGTQAISTVSGLQTALDGKQPSGSYAAASHAHDDRYYTETEVNNLLAQKQGSGDYSDATHSHDDRYYTEAETNNLLNGKAASTHGHALTDANITGTIPNAQLPARIQMRPATVTDWNDALETGWFMASGAANAPEASKWFMGTVVAHNALWVTQTLHAFTEDSSANSAAWRRTSTDSGGTRVWSAWYRIRLTEAELDSRYQAKGSYAAATHTHDDRYYTETETNNLLAGKQAAGSYAAASHTHPASQVTDFTEAVQDAVAALLAAGTGVTLSYDDNLNQLTITGTGGTSNLDAEAVRDAIGVALVGSGLITVTVNDAADTITISTTATQNSTDAALRARSSHTGTQSASTISDFDTEVSNNTDVAANTAARHSHSNKATLDAITAAFTTALATKLNGIEAGAEVNNLSDAQATDLTDGGASTAHYHTADRARANHTGTQSASTISNFDSAVRGNRLDQMAAPLAPVAIGGFRLTGVADGIDLQDAATKGQLENATAGFTGGIELDYSERTSDFVVASGSGYSDVTGIEVSFVMPNRPVMLVLECLVLSTYATGSQPIVAIKEGVTTIRQAHCPPSAHGSDFQRVYSSARVTGGAGTTRTFYLQCTRRSGDYSLKGHASYPIILAAYQC